MFPGTLDLWSNNSWARSVSLWLSNKPQGLGCQWMCLTLKKNYRFVGTCFEHVLNHQRWKVENLYEFMLFFWWSSLACRTWACWVLGVQVAQRIVEMCHQKTQVTALWWFFTHDLLETSEMLTGKKLKVSNFFQNCEMMVNFCQIQAHQENYYSIYYSCRKQSSQKTQGRSLHGQIPRYAHRTGDPEFVMIFPTAQHLRLASIGHQSHGQLENQAFLENHRTFNGPFFQYQ